MESNIQPLSNQYPHLIAKAAAIAGEGLLARMDFLQEPHWVGYRAAKMIRDRVDVILRGPRVDRMESLLIVGETNNGKTRIIRRITDFHPPVERPDGSFERSILAIQAPPVADEKRLYGAILSRAGSPVRSYHSAGVQYQAVEKVLHGLGVKILIIDEVQHLISGSTQKHRDCMQALKYMSNELQISLVAAGIQTAQHAIATWDQQIENRFRPHPLPRWCFGPELARLLKSIEQIIPLRKPSNLDDPAIVQRIADLGDGKIGEIWTLLVLAAQKAMESGQEHIDLSVIKQVESIAPVNRRALIYGTGLFESAV